MLAQIGAKKESAASKKEKPPEQDRIRLHLMEGLLKQEDGQL